MRKVLIVEDSVSARAYVRAVLEGHEFRSHYGDCQVAEATGGFDAMRLLPRGPYDLIITDINMSDINGLELIRFIRNSAHHAGTPLVIISSLRSAQDVERGLTLGANAYLPKPFTPDQLLGVCIRLLEPARAEVGEPPSGTL
ncbi:MAG: response regulator [Polyangiaceae bacterium]|jgi:two-component system chemotaxis response regulator CheY